MDYRDFFKNGNKHAIKKVNTFSSDFWVRPTAGINESRDGKSILKLIQLSQAQKAVTNFVKILTQKEIPIEFNTDGKSATNNERILIGCKVEKQADLDVTVGLALHEASHMLLTNFDTIGKTHIKALMTSFGINKNDDYVAATSAFLNWVEDRRIDNYVQKEAPGYVGYYDALYNKYFNSENVSQGILSGEFREENIDSYMFRIINLTNENTQLNALKGLAEISDIIDVKNISRIKNTECALECACEIMIIVAKNIEQAKKEEEREETKKEEESEKQKSKKASDSNSKESEETEESETGKGDNSKDSDDKEEGENESKGSSSKSEESDEKESENETGSKGSSPKSEKSDEEGTSSENKSEGEESEDSNKGNKADPNESTSSEGTSENESEAAETFPEVNKAKLQNDIKQQKRFLEHDIDKKKLRKKADQSVKRVKESGIEIKKTASEIPFVIINEFNAKFIQKNRYVGIIRRWNCSYGLDTGQDLVNTGIANGKQLLRKLKLRNEERATNFTHKRNGKLDGRLLHELAYDNDKVFSQMNIDKYKNTHLHMTIDASGSMAGTSWDNTMKMAVAIAYSADKIKNMSLVIDFRSVMSNGDDIPLVLVAFDSRKDSFQKIKNLFKYLTPYNTTPEGIIFEGMMSDYVPGSVNLDSYLINFSDGMPYCGYTIGNKHYSYVRGGYRDNHVDGVTHTAKQVKKIRNKNIKVLSYFLNQYHTTVTRAFTEMYGKDAEMINPDNMSELARTLNKKFMIK